MFRIRAVLVTAALAISATTSLVATRAGADSGVGPTTASRASLVGTWELTSFEARTGDGRVIYPFGQDAEGLLTYTRDGRMCAAVWKANRPPFAVNDQQRGTPDEYTAAVQSYIQYVGTFEVDRQAGTVSHHVVQSIFPNWNGTTQVRFYQFIDDGNSLDLTTPPVQFGGTTLVAHLIWHRVIDD
jgi:hypothetical protein